MANEEQELKDLKADAKFAKLIQMLEGDNVADFFGIDNKEIKHSNALSKLFNVRDYKSYWTIEFVKYFLDKSKIKLPKDFDYSSLRVKREYVLPPNNKIDIMLYSSVTGKETVILIENKFDATESEGQLAKYEDGIKAIPAFRNYKCYYIFLTKDGRAASSAKNNDLWKPVSYRVIIDMLEKVVKEIKSKLSEEMLNILNQYKQLLRRKMIMGKDIVLDKKCEDLCLSLVAYKRYNRIP